MDDSEKVICFPGDRLCASNENTIAGSGTYERAGYIYSSLAGTVETTSEDKVSFAKHVSQKFMISFNFRILTSKLMQLETKQFFP